MQRNNMNTDKLKEEAFQYFIENPYWKETYENAPELAKEYYRTTFAISVPAIGNGGMSNVPYELTTELDTIYDRLDKDAWKYILNHTSGPSKLGLGRIMKSRLKTLN